MKKNKHLFVIYAFVGIVVFSVLYMFLRESKVNEFTELQQQYIGFTFEELVLQKKDENNTISNIISYRDKLYDYFENNYFEFVEKYEEVRKYDYGLVAMVDLKMARDQDYFNVSFQFLDGKLDTHPRLQIYGTRENDQFPLGEEFEFLFDYLSFEDGLTVIRNAYETYEIDWQQGSVLIPHDLYQISIYEDYQNNKYHYECSIGYYYN